MADNSPDRIFWAEADDDALRMEDKHVARGSLLAYLLLRKEVVGHPAYTFQSEDTHSILVGSRNTLVAPPNLYMVLGDSPSVEDYMFDRKGKLEREVRVRRTPDIPELVQYARYGEGLIRDSVYLDEKFTAVNAIHKISWSRDRQFRQVVRRDLEARTPVGDTLYGLIFRCRGKYPTRKFDDLIQRLIDRTMNMRMLCSVDSFMAILVGKGFDPRDLRQVFDRLHILHWESHSGPGLRVPLLSRKLHGSLDAYDPTVFWKAMEHLIGSDMRRTLLELPWDDACGMVADLRAHGEWIDFVATYELIVQTVDVESEEIFREFVDAELDRAYPSLFRGLWHEGRPTKFGLLSFVCGVLSLSAGITPVGVLGLTAGLGDIVQQWVRITQQYFTSGERHSVKTHIYGALRRAKSRRRNLGTPYSIRD